MTQIGYRVVERFSPSAKESWPKYIEWSGLTQLVEVVGLDCSLCPSVFGEFISTDWDHLVFGKQLGDCFDNCEYLLNRVAVQFDSSRHQVLAVAREVSENDLERSELSGFRFMGFELVEEATSISALTNCGGFKGAFEKSDVSNVGLVASASRAYAIREALATLYPEEHHAQCAVWALWRHETA